MQCFPYSTKRKTRPLCNHEYYTFEAGASIACAMFRRNRWKTWRSRGCQDRMRDAACKMGALLWHAKVQRQKSCLTFSDTSKGTSSVHLAVQFVAMLVDVSSSISRLGAVRRRKDPMNPPSDFCKIAARSFHIHSAKPRENPHYPPKSCARYDVLDLLPNGFVLCTTLPGIRQLTRFADIEQALQSKWTDPDHLVSLTRRISTERSGAHIS
jgi:hypothetical protein